MQCRLYSHIHHGQMHDLMLSCALSDSPQSAVLPAVNQFPAEEVRRALGDRIQLTENQVQV